MMKLEVYNIGSKVKLTEDVEGIIIGIGINGDNNITYECGWWNGRSYDTRWFHANEIEVITAKKTKIGFV
jgi:uncharacterized protein YodC (DUF2158 family)